jgi:hypothetical protein
MGSSNQGVDVVCRELYHIGLSEEKKDRGFKF